MLLCASGSQRLPYSKPQKPKKFWNFLGHSEFCSDPHRKAVLINLQQMWIALGNQRIFLTQDELAREAEAIGRHHVKFGSANSVPVH
jgi:mannose-1-phosphate guanylyltransferase